jgi:hypothetical protein
LSQCEFQRQGFAFQFGSDQFSAEHAQADAASTHAGTDHQAWKLFTVHGTHRRDTVGQGAAQACPSHDLTGGKGAAHGFAQGR